MITNFELRDDFVGIFYSDINCSQYITYHKQNEQTDNIIRRRNFKGDTIETHQRAQVVQDDVVGIDSTCHMINFNRNIGLMKDYNNLTSEAMNLYVEKWNSVGNFDFQQAYMNIQKTSKSQGYHVWHYENGSFANNRRMFATMLYLNDVEEGGETEFLYQSFRVKPERGKFLIWPAQWTHTHRGNPPLSGEKYIVTSWIENTEL